MSVHGLSLRTRLTLGVLVLTALGLVLAATATTLLLRSYLVAQVDAQLSGAPRFSGPEGGSVGPAPSQDGQLPSPFVLTRLDASGAVLSQVRGTQVATAPAPDLTGLTSAEVAARGSEPFDVTGVDSSFSYRAIALPASDGSGSAVLAISTEPIDDTVQRAMLASLAVGLLTLGLVGLVAGGVVRVGLRPLDDVERTAERIAAGDLTQRVPDMPQGTEIGRLSASLNGMLGQIETAFDERRASEDRLRRFVGDASHELRTPLTTIRGYAELQRSGALADDAGRAMAAARIEEEAARMGVLVDELLLLARLDQQRPLERDRVDLVVVAAAAVDALRAAAPDRDIAFRAPDSAVVLGDGARLRQVVDNLAANARVHTPAGSAIVIEVAVGSDAVRLDVRDSGPGMSAEDVDHAFERFYRGDPSRTRASGGGSGLGLSIAEAIVGAQDGTLRLVSEAGEGTTATVLLPLASEPEGRQVAVDGPDGLRAAQLPTPLTKA